MESLLLLCFRCVVDSVDKIDLAAIKLWPEELVSHFLHYCLKSKRLTSVVLSKFAGSSLSQLYLQQAPLRFAASISDDLLAPRTLHIRKLINDDWLCNGTLRLPRLTKLCLANCFITDACLGTFLALHPTLTSLTLMDCSHITGACLSQASVALLELNITQSDLPARGFNASLAHLTQLTHLTIRLHYTPARFLLDQIAFLSSLRILALERLNFTDISALTELLPKLYSLEQLSVLCNVSSDRINMQHRNNSHDLPFTENYDMPFTLLAMALHRYCTQLKSLCCNALDIVFPADERAVYETAAFLRYLPSSLEDLRLTTLLPSGSRFVSNSVWIENILPSLLRWDSNETFPNLSHLTSLEFAAIHPVAGNTYGALALQLFRSVPQLVELAIFSFHSRNASTANVLPDFDMSSLFPSLRKLHCVLETEWPQNMQKALAKMTHLDRLQLNICGTYHRSTFVDILPPLSMSGQLTTLHIDMCHMPTLSLGHMEALAPSLETLEMTLDSPTVNEILEACKNFSALTNLTSLSLTAGQQFLRIRSDAQTRALQLPPSLKHFAVNIVNNPWLTEGSDILRVDIVSLLMQTPHLIEFRCNCRSIAKVVPPIDTSEYNTLASASSTRYRCSSLQYIELISDGVGRFREDIQAAERGLMETLSLCALPVVVRLRACGRFDITSQSLSAIIHAMPHVAELNLANCCNLTSLVPLNDVAHELYMLSVASCANLQELFYRPLPSLCVLNLDSCIRLGASEITRIVSTQLCPHLIVLKIDMCFISNALLEAISAPNGLTQLEELAMDGCNGFTMEGLAALTSLRSLRVLSIHACPVIAEHEALLQQYEDEAEKTIWRYLIQAGPSSSVISLGFSLHHSLRESFTSYQSEFIRRTTNFLTFLWWEVVSVTHKMNSEQFASWVESRTRTSWLAQVINLLALLVATQRKAAKYTAAEEPLEKTPPVEEFWMILRRSLSKLETDCNAPEEFLREALEGNLRWADYLPPKPRLPSVTVLFHNVLQRSL